MRKERVNNQTSFSAETCRFSAEICLYFVTLLLFFRFFLSFFLLQSLNCLSSLERNVWEEDDITTVIHQTVHIESFPTATIKRKEVGEDIINTIKNHLISFLLFEKKGEKKGNQTSFEQIKQKY